MQEDLRLIEDYLPIEAISAEASREKSVRKDHISTLHLWWAQRPLVTCGTAAYGALVPTNRWVKNFDVMNPLGDNYELISIHNQTERLDHAKREGVVDMMFCTPAQAIAPVGGYR